MNKPKKELDMFEAAQKVKERKHAEQKKAAFTAWLWDKSIDILALIVAVIALFRTF